MSKSGEQHFNRIYLIFSLLLILLVLGYTGTILYTVGLNRTVVWISILFVMIMFVTGGAWVWSLKSRIAGTFRTLDDVIDGAINGQDRLTGYEETNISSLENKLIRYIDLSTTHDKKVEAEKNKIKELISDISHQTKTPLSNIVLYSQLLAESEHAERYQNVHEFVTQIKSQSDKLDWLIQSLIKMSRLETEIISIHAIINPVIESISKAVSQVYTQAQRKNIKMTIDCDGDVLARHDMKWTSEALFNIMENAVKYSNNQGEIHITARSNEMFTVIDIADNGMGIEESELNHIFKRFYRCKATSKYEGVGIGLFLAREIINSQGGYIMASSTLGKGSTFSVYLLRL